MIYTFYPSFPSCTWEPEEKSLPIEAAEEKGLKMRWEITRTIIIIIMALGLLAINYARKNDKGDLALLPDFIKALAIIILSFWWLNMPGSGSAFSIHIIRATITIILVFWYLKTPGS